MRWSRRGDHAVGGLEGEAGVGEAPEGRPLSIGASAVGLVFELQTTNESLEVGELYVSEGKAIEALEYTAGAPGMTAAEDVALARKIATHLQEASQPPPSGYHFAGDHGDPQPGQILTATPGTWAGHATDLRLPVVALRCCRTELRADPQPTLTTYTVSVADRGRPSQSSSPRQPQPARSRHERSRPRRSRPARNLFRPDGERRTYNGIDLIRRRDARASKRPWFLVEERAEDAFLVSDPTEVTRSGDGFETVEVELGRHALD